MSSAQISRFAGEVARRLDALTRGAEAGTLGPAIDIIVDAIRTDGVVHAFGTGHSEAFAMEIAGRAGGLVPTHKVALRDVVLSGARPVSDLYATPPLERDPDIAAAVFDTIVRRPSDAFVIASNSGVNGAVVGLALLAKEHGHPVIAVTSLAHTAAVSPAHPSGKRLSDVADVVIDNLAPFGDTVLDEPVGVGAVSSITSAYIAQLLTVGAVQRLAENGTPPVFLSANIPGGDERNSRLEARYGDRIRRVA